MDMDGARKNLDLSSTDSLLYCLCIGTEEINDNDDPEAEKMQLYIQCFRSKHVNTKNING